MDRVRRLLLIGGVLAPPAYMLAVLLGTWLRPGYDWISQPISELIASGAPNKVLLDRIFIVYNAFGLAFALGVLASVRADDRGRRIGAWAAAILVLAGGIGLATVFFPQDPGGRPVTPAGTVHIALAGMNSLATIAAMLLLGFWFDRTGRPGSARLSFLGAAVVIVSGAAAALSTVVLPQFSGLLERVTIFGFLLWMFVVSFRLVRMPSAA